jgi:tRNA U34 5-methylaminomethyl-2-thiouridine-forming methyltransferase MnmC
MKRDVIVTADGSKTIYIQEMDENYHSSHGALQEANHVFIQNGLQFIDNQSTISVFEMGFGTGLNALLTLVEADKIKNKINYVGIEAFPVEIELINQIGYEQFVDPKFQSLFTDMHTANWNEKIDLTPYFSFEKIHEKIKNYEVLEAEFDIVYYDAFGPRAQEAMWLLEILEKMYRMLKPGGFLVTYCAKGQVKRDLKALGFKIEALPGPPGKREMTRAHKNL